MFQRFAACQARRPVATCLVTGASVMSIGDSAVQLCGSGTLDLERNVVVSAYNGGSEGHGETDFFETSICGSMQRFLSV